MDELQKAILDLVDSDVEEGGTGTTESFSRPPMETNKVAEKFNFRKPKNYVHVPALLPPVDNGYYE